MVCDTLPLLYIHCLLQTDGVYCTCDSDLCNSGRQEVGSLASLLLVVAVSLAYHQLYRTKM